jgi:hypothetical protein
MVPVAAALRPVALKWLDALSPRALGSAAARRWTQAPGEPPIEIIEMETGSNRHGDVQQAAPLAGGQD